MMQVNFPTIRKLFSFESLSFSKMPKPTFTMVSGFFDRLKNNVVEQSSSFARTATQHPWQVGLGLAVGALFAGTMGLMYLYGAKRDKTPQKSIQDLFTDWRGQLTSTERTQLSNVMRFYQLKYPTLKFFDTKEKYKVDTVIQFVIIGLKEGVDGFVKHNRLACGLISFVSTYRPHLISPLYTDLATRTSNFLDAFAYCRKATEADPTNLYPVLIEGRLTKQNSMGQAHHNLTKLVETAEKANFDKAFIGTVCFELYEISKQESYFDKNQWLEKAKQYGNENALALT